MKKEEKAVIVDNLEEIFTKSTGGVMTNYRGMKTGDLLEIRKKLKAADGKYIVVKNSLAHRAAAKAGIDSIDTLLSETTAIAFGFGELQVLAAALTDFARTTKTSFLIKGGFLGNRLLTKEDVDVLTTLPSMPVLIAQLMGQLNAPVAHLMAQLNAPVSGLVNVLNARKEQIEGGSN